MRFLAQSDGADAAASLPLSQPFETACLFADVSGFTKLGEHFASNERGAEHLARFLNSYME